MLFGRSMMAATAIVATAAVASAAVPSPRATLVRAAFATNSKPQALALVNAALSALGDSPADREAQLQRGIGLGYRGQLTRSIADAKASRTILGGLAQSDPRDPEAQIALGGWHLSVLGTVGSFLGGSVLGANRDKGLAALDRAVQLGGNRAFFPAYAGLMRIRSNPDDKLALPLLDRAARGQTPTEVDKITRAAAVKVAAQLRAGDKRGAAAAAETLLPFGQVN